MPDLKSFIAMLLNKNPQIANNPQAKEYLDIIMKGDAKRGEEIASNICKTYNISKEDGTNEAMRFFMPFFRQ